ncbi:S-layer homology domain-containing protein [Paenibacillus contaminans]|nr:S-layer homology domain-containing protein [Paenibacillus contaminans]
MIDYVPTKNFTIIITDPSHGGVEVKDKITKLVGEQLRLTGKLFTADGKDLQLPTIDMKSDGSFSMPSVPAGEYKLLLNVVAPTGEKLIGNTAKLIIDKNGNATLVADLIDPFGKITDNVTGKEVKDVKVTLYWADTELNRAKGRKPNTEVALPNLPDFAPNQNHNPQLSDANGDYAWMVFPEGDYYILGEKDGYVAFDSRKDMRDETHGEDSYIRNGIIHVGQSIVRFDIALQPKVVESGEHKLYIYGYPDGSFRPERGISRAEIAAILFRTMPFASGMTTDKIYTDVDQSHWAYNEIMNAAQQKWMLGYEQGDFQPEKFVTRAELAQILFIVKKWGPAANSSFQDVKGHWAETAIAAAEKQGVLDGYPDGTFRPDQAIRRDEAVHIFNLLLDRHPWKIKVPQKWTDIPETHWDYDAIMEASVPHAYEIFEDGTEDWKLQ